MKTYFDYLKKKKSPLSDIANECYHNALVNTTHRRQPGLCNEFEVRQD